MFMINGKEIKLKLDFGATRLMKKEHGINFYGISEERAGDPDVIAGIIMACAKRGGNELTDEDIDNMTIPEIIAANEAIAKMVVEFMPESKGTVKNTKRQN